MMSRNITFVEEEYRDPEKDGPHLFHVTVKVSDDLGNIHTLHYKWDTYDQEWWKRHSDPYDSISENYIDEWYAVKAVGFGEISERVGHSIDYKTRD